MQSFSSACYKQKQPSSNKILATCVHKSQIDSTAQSFTPTICTHKVVKRLFVGLNEYLLESVGKIKPKIDGEKQTR